MPSLFDTPISKPFDPASLKVEVKNTTVGQLRDMLKNKMIDLQPDFQRHGDLWDNKKKSRLIESIILGLPLPSFYFYVDEEREKWVVIDGLQRLCSISDFMVEQKLRLTGLQFLGNLHNRHGYDDFSYFEQLDMSMRSVTLNVISGASSAEAKYIIFQRINSMGTQLKPAEIRNALFHGKSMEMVKNLAESKEFEKATNNSVSQRRLLHYDFVARFFAFYIQGFENFESNKMDWFIGKSLEMMNQKCGDNAFEQLKKVFFESLSVCHALLGNDVFRQPLTDEERKNKDVKANPVSISLFEAMMCSIARISDVQRKSLLERRNKYSLLYREMFKDEFLRKELSKNTNRYKSIYYRFSKMDELVMSVLK